MTGGRPEAAPVPALVVTPVVGLPEVGAGDDLAALVVAGLGATGVSLVDGDVLVVSSKVVSKAMGRTAARASREEVIAQQTRRVVAERMSAAGLTQVVESAAGPVLAAAGVDTSNTGHEELLLVLPEDPDAAAAALRTAILAATPARRPDQDDPAPPPVARLGLVLSDTAGRPWREGQTDFALGSAGLVVAEDLRGATDADGQQLRVTVRAVADEIAAAADLVKGKTSGLPVAHLRGLGHLVPGGPGPTPAGARSLVRVGAPDWFGYGHVEAVRAALGVLPGSAAATSVGIPSVLPEDVDVVAGRAVRLALHGLLAASPVTAERTWVGVRLRCPDPFTLGYAAARLVVALAAEGIAAAPDPATRPVAGRAGVAGGADEGGVLVVFGS